MNTLEHAEAYSTLIHSSTMLLVQFGSHTCAPCTAIMQKIDSWCAEHPLCRSLYVPVEQFRELAAGESVFSVPTILVYIEGRVTIRESGYFSLEEIFNRMERYIALLQD